MDGLQDAYNITGAKNILPNILQDGTDSNITFTKNSDGSVNIVSPGSGPSSPMVGRAVSTGNTLGPGTYTISLGLDQEIESNVLMYARNTVTGVTLARTDYRGGFTNTFTLDSAMSNIEFYIMCYSGSAINVRVFPMCRVASVTDDTYVPYAMTNRQLTDIKRVELSNREVMAYKVGRLVVLNIGKHLELLAGENNIGIQLPEDFWPFEVIRNTLSWAGRTDVVDPFVYVTNNGYVYVYSWYTMTGDVYGSLVYFAVK